MVITLPMPPPWVRVVEPFGISSAVMALKLVARCSGLKVARSRFSSPPISAWVWVWQPMHWLVSVQVRVEVSV
jgi:hypothetical protein